MAVKIDKIPQMVRFHRKRSGLTQLELGQLAGVGKTAVFDVERGKITVQWATLVKILHVLNIQIHFESPLMNEFEEKDHEKG